MKLTKLAVEVDSSNGNEYEKEMWSDFQHEPWCQNINLAGAVVVEGVLRPAMARALESVKELFQ